MLRRALLVPFLVLTIVPASAQEKLKDLSLKDAIVKAGSDFAPEHMKAPQWIPNTANYCYVKDDALVRGGIGKIADQRITGLAELNALLPKDKALQGFPAIAWDNSSAFHFDDDGTTYDFDLAKNTVAARYSIDAKAERTDEDTSARQVAYTIGEDLYITRPGGAAERVTNDGADGIVNGRSVHREEYGITKGTFWSPDGSRLAFYRMDESMVTPYYLENINDKPSTFKKIRYPMAGQTSHHVTLGIYDVKAKKAIFLKTIGAADDYLTNISWEPDNRHVWIIHLNRATDHLKVVRYDAITGEPAKPLIEEDDKKWLEPLHTLMFLKKTPSRFICWSQKDGWPHLYLYDTDKGLVRQLTTGAWVVKDILGTDAKEGALFVEGTDNIDAKDPKGAMETQLYRLDITSGKATKLTKDAGTHHALLSSDGRFLIDQWSSISVPGRTEIIDAVKGNVLKTLVVSKDPLAGYNVGTEEFVAVPGENGDVLNARVIKPHGFDSRKQYPVIVYVYNGPHVQLVTNSFLGGASLWMLHAAQRGYVVFTVDGHGSENRGRDFEQIIHRQLGVTEVKDQLRGVDWLKSQPWVDPNRMAVHGWSFGGHVTTALMLRSPETFKVAVAGGPVMDWSMYEVMYTERYMDTPQENPDGYALTMNTDKAKNLKGKLLIIHGNQDDTVLPEHSLRFLKNCVDNGVQLDFFEYPGHPHNVRGKDRVHLYTKVLDYIDANIGPAR